MARRRPILASAVLVAGLLAAAVAPTYAAYPGATNGRIAFGTRATDGSSAIWTVMPPASAATG